MSPEWKKWFWRSAGFGVGVGVALCAVIGLVLLYSSSPQTPGPWNTKAITATFDEFTVSNGEKSIFIQFAYTLQNNTNRDYTMPDKVKIMSRDTKDALDNIEGWIKVNTFAPAHQKSKFSFTLPVGNASDSVKAKEDDKFLIKKASSWVADVKGFAVFDEQNRYQIELPTGWSSIKQEDGASW